MSSKMKSSFVIVLLLLLCGISVELLREYRVVSKPVTWYEAQSYCRQTFTDLATITTNEEEISLQSEGYFRIYGWIGLKRTKPLSDTWQWSDGQTPTFFNWEFNMYTKDEPTEDCVYSAPQGWYTLNCSKRLYFFCHKNLKLVEENERLVEEEALEYCKTYHTSLAFPSLTSQLRLTEREDTSLVCGLVCASLTENECSWPGRRCRVRPRCPHAQHHITAVELTTSTQMSGRIETATRSFISSVTERVTGPQNINQNLYLSTSLD